MKTLSCLGVTLLYKSSTDLIFFFPQKRNTERLVRKCDRFHRHSRRLLLALRVAAGIAVILSCSYWFPCGFKTGYKTNLCVYKSVIMGLCNRYAVGSL